MLKYKYKYAKNTHFKSERIHILMSKLNSRIKKILSAFMCAAMVIPLASCGKKTSGPANEIGKVEESSVGGELAKGDSLASENLPTYDKNTLPMSETQISKEFCDVYYVTNQTTGLNPTLVSAYNDIKGAIEDNRNEVVLGKEIPSSDLFRIMLIIYTNEYELMYIDSQYEYEPSDTRDGYVKKVTIKYRDDADAIKKSINSTKERALRMFTQYTPDPTLSSEANQKLMLDYNVLNDILADPAIRYSKNYFLDSREMAMQYSYLCRYLGINNIVKMGVLTDADMIAAQNAQVASASRETGPTNIRALSDEQKCTVQEDKKFVVDYNLDDYVFWNIVQIGGGWYNVDLASETYYLSLYPEGTWGDRCKWFDYVNDYTMSMSRIYKYNDDLLGVTPNSNSSQYGDIYRSGNFYLAHTYSQMKNRLADDISLYKGRKDKKYAFQFENEETFEYFVAQFDELMAAYNKMNNTPIIGYTITPQKAALVVTVTNLKFR